MELGLDNADLDRAIEADVINISTPRGRSRSSSNIGSRQSATIPRTSQSLATGPHDQDLQATMGKHSTQDLNTDEVCLCDLSGSYAFVDCIYD